jgi:hypothetical protein
MTRTSLLLLAALPLLAAGGAATFRMLIPQDVPVKEAASTPEAAYAAAPGSGAFGVKIELEVSRAGSAFRAVPLSTPVCNGDFVAFRFTPSAGGFATVVNHGTSGKWSTIWPAREWEDPSFGPKRPVRLPSDEGAGFPLSGPAGEEYVMIFFSPTPFSAELKKLHERLIGLEEPPQAVAAAQTGGGTRAVQVTLLRDLGAARAAYAVGQGEQTVAFALDHREVCGELP